MLNWFICLVRRHRYCTWFDAEMRRNRTFCERCGIEKTPLFDLDMNPNFF